MKVFHSITVQLLVQQTSADPFGNDADEARALLERTVGAACDLLSVAAGRETRVKAIVVNPVRVLEPDAPVPKEQTNET